MNGSEADWIQLLLQRGMVTREQVESCRADGAGADGLIDALVRRNFVDRAALDSLRSYLPTIGTKPPQDAVLGETRGYDGPLSPVRAPAQSRLGRYEILEEIGHGGMGVVYKAWDPELQRLVAIKGILGFVCGIDDPQSARFRNEARAAARLKHTGIVQVHEAGEADGQAYLVMDFIAGRTLRDHLAQRPGDAREAARLVRDVAEAIAYAHREGVIHRDLKPDNVLVDEQGRAFVGDFGLARRVTDAARLTAHGEILGTPSYMAPEQAEGRQDEIGPLADVYGIGAILYESLTGRPPFEGENIPEVLHRVVHQDPVRPSVVDSRVPRELEAICLKCLEKEPDRRYAGAAETAADLGRWLAGEPVQAQPPSALRLARRWVMRRRALAVAALVALVLGLVALYAQHSRAAMQQELIAGLEEVAAGQQDAILELRRAGASMYAARRNLLPKLEAAVRRVIERAPELAEPHYLLGRADRALLRFADAEAEQERALAKEPDYAPSRYERAVLRAAALRKRVEELRNSWWREEGRRLAATGNVAQGGMGGAELRPCPPDDALAAEDPRARDLRISILRDLDAVEVGFLPTAQLACARGLRHSLDAAGRKEAQSELERALREDSALDEAHEALAALALAAGEIRRAETLYGNALERDKGYVPYWMGRGTVRNDIGTALDARGQDPGAAFAGAEEDFGKAIDLDPDSADAWFARGTLRGTMAQSAERFGQDPAARFAAAESDLTHALQLAPERPEIRVARGAVRVNVAERRRMRGEDPTEEYRLSESDFDQALSTHPDAWEAALSRAQLRSSWGLYDEARGEDPDPRYAGAEADFTRGLELRPDCGSAWMMRGALRGNWGFADSKHGRDPLRRYADAEADYARALQIEPRSAPTWGARGDLRLNWGQYRSAHGEDPEERFRGAVEDYGRAIALDRQESSAWSGRGNAFMSRGLARESRGEDPTADFVGAEADDSEAIRLRPDLAEAWSARGDLRVNRAGWRRAHGEDATDSFRAAEDDYSRALERNPLSAETWSKRGMGRMNQAQWLDGHGQDPFGLFAAAESDLTHALDLHARSAEAWGARGLLRADVALARKRRGEDPAPEYLRAEADFSKALEFDPAASELWLRRGLMRMNRGADRDREGQDPTADYRAAEADFGKALDLDPAGFEGWLWRGLLRANWSGFVAKTGGDADALYAAAEADLSKSLERNPQHAASWRWRGFERNRRGNLAESSGKDPSKEYAEAEADFARAIELDATCAESRWRRGRLYNDMKRWSDALVDFLAARTINPGCESEFRSLLVLAYYNVACGQAGTDRGAAFANLRAAVELGWNDRGQLESDPDLAPLRSDPRWQELLAGLK